MVLRTSKVLLVFAISLYYALLVLNNTTDYDSNYQVIRHVLMMDTTLPDNHAMWRALNSPAWHRMFYGVIVLSESAITVLALWGGVVLARALRRNSGEFQQAKSVAIGALTAALLLWLVAFLTVGGEWFLMWQSKTWNGQEPAGRMFLVTGVVLLLLIQPDTEAQS